MLYVTGSNNNAWAIDAHTGRTFWRYRRNLPNDLTYGASAPVNRGFGMLGDRLFMVTWMRICWRSTAAMAISCGTLNWQITGLAMPQRLPLLYSTAKSSSVFQAANTGPAGLSMLTIR